MWGPTEIKWHPDEVKQIYSDLKIKKKSPVPLFEGSESLMMRLANDRQLI